MAKPKSWRRIGTLHGSDAGRLAIKVWVCNGCGTWHEAKIPAQCMSCGRMDFTFFPSKTEARRFSELKLRVRAGIIKDLLVQVRFDLMTVGPNGLPCKFGEYVADFTYTVIETGVKKIEDVKPNSGADPVFKLKARCMEAMGLPVQIITSKGAI